METARRFPGLPYLWGGTSAKGFDSSGFTKTVFWLNGIVLPRNADQQAERGLEITPSEGLDNLRPGDLRFFGRRADGSRPEHVTHVGIYIGGREFIHCSPLVTIDSLDSKAPNFNEYRSNSLLHVRRIAG